MVFRAAYRVTGNAGDAEDVLQTVFLRLVKRDPSAEPVGNVPSFLHRAAVNAALDLVRARQNVRNIPLDELEPVLAEGAHRGPDRLQGSGEIREWLRLALGNVMFASSLALLGKAGLDIPAAGLIGIPLLVLAVCGAVLRRRSHPRPVQVPS